MSKWQLPVLEKKRKGEFEKIFTKNRLSTNVSFPSGSHYLFTEIGASILEPFRWAL